MKIIHTADWHIGKFLKEYSMIDDQKYFFDQLINYIKLNNVDLLIIAGDVYDKFNPSSESIDLLNHLIDQFINKLKIKVIVIAGNHDNRKQLGFGKKIFEKNYLYIETEISENIKKIELEDNYGKLNFYLIPYFRIYDIKSKFKTQEIITYDQAINIIFDKIKESIDITKRNILVSHGFYSYFKNDKYIQPLTSDSELSIGGCEVIKANNLEIFDYVALGHLHCNQKVGLDHIRYSGSNLNYSIDEIKQQKSITIVDLKEKGNLDIKLEHFLPYRKIIKLTGNFEEILEMDKITPEIKTNYIYVILTDNYKILNAMSRLRQYYPYILGLEYEIDSFNQKNSELKINTIKTKSIDNIFKDFYEEVSKKHLTADQMLIINKVIKNIEDEII